MARKPLIPASFRKMLFAFTFIAGVGGAVGAIYAGYSFFEAKGIEKEQIKSDIKSLKETVSLQEKINKDQEETIIKRGEALNNISESLKTMNDNLAVMNKSLNDQSTRMGRIEGALKILTEKEFYGSAMGPRSTLNGPNN